MKIAYFDCFAGISGDMTLGALVGAGADPEGLREGLAGLGIRGYRIEVGKKTTGPIEATAVRVILDGRSRRHERRLRDILEIIGAAGLSAKVKRTAERIFRGLAQAEGRVHGLPPEEVHFHEVGSVDAIVDIVGAALCLEMLGWPRVVSSPMPTFHGFAKAAHGVFPLPAPATAELLRGVPWRHLDVEGELVTPTGAAIITGIAADFGPLPAMTVETIGYGAGQNDFAIPNALRIKIGREMAEKRTSTVFLASRIALKGSKCKGLRKGLFCRIRCKAGIEKGFHHPFRGGSDRDHNKEVFKNECKGV